MADAVASDPRMKKLQGMLPRRITAAEALKLRAMKLKHTQKAANRDMAEILAFEQPQLAPALGKSKVAVYEKFRSKHSLFRHSRT